MFEKLGSDDYWHVRPIYMAVRCRKNLAKGKLTFRESASETVRNILERATKYKFLCPDDFSKLAVEACKRYSGNWYRTYSSLGISRVHGHYKNGLPVGFSVLSEMAKHIKNAEGDYSVIFYDKDGKSRFDYSVNAIEEKEEKLVREAKHMNMFVHGRSLSTYPVTWLCKCQLCGIMSTPKKVNERSVCGWDGNERYGSSKTKLCMKCWNKVQPIYRSFKEAENIKYLSNKLLREVSKCQKSKQPAI